MPLNDSVGVTLKKKTNQKPNKPKASRAGGFEAKIPKNHPVLGEPGRPCRDAGVAEDPPKTPVGSP